VLVVVAFSIFSHGVPQTAGGGMDRGCASVVWASASRWGNDGLCINRRATWVALVHWLLPIPGKGGSNWSYALIPIVVRCWAARWQECWCGLRICDAAHDSTSQKRDAGHPVRRLYLFIET